MTKVVTQKGTLSGRRDLTISILCSSLQEFSHSPVGDVCVLGVVWVLGVVCVCVGCVENVCLHVYFSG